MTLGGGVCIIELPQVFVRPPLASLAGVLRSGWMRGRRSGGRDAAEMREGEYGGWKMERGMPVPHQTLKFRENPPSF